MFVVSWLVWGSHLGFFVAVLLYFTRGMVGCSSQQGLNITVLPATEVISLSQRIEVNKSYLLLPGSCCKATQTSAPCCFWMLPATAGETIEEGH